MNSLEEQKPLCFDNSLVSMAGALLLAEGEAILGYGQWSVLKGCPSYQPLPLVNRLLQVVISIKAGVNVICELFSKIRGPNLKPYTSKQKR